LPDYCICAIAAFIRDRNPDVTGDEFVKWHIACGGAQQRLIGC